MGWLGGNLSNSPEWAALNSRLSALERRLGVNTQATTTSANALKTTPKRFRVAVAQVRTTKADGPTSIDVAWSSPLPSDTYNVDVSCTSTTLIGTPTVINQTKDGCTILLDSSRVTPGAIVVVLAIAPAPAP